jgi:hypothetical protein
MQSKDALAIRFRTCAANSSLKTLTINVNSSRRTQGLSACSPLSKEKTRGTPAARKTSSSPQAMSSMRMTRRGPSALQRPARSNGPTFCARTVNFAPRLTQIKVASAAAPKARTSPRVVARRSHPTVFDKLKLIS